MQYQQTMTDDARRVHFRDWFRSEMRRLDFWRRRGNHYFTSEFVRYAAERGATLDDVSLGRYLREEKPILPTPESCRTLARALGRSGTEVLMVAGYLTGEDVQWIIAEYERGSYGVPDAGGRSVREQHQSHSPHPGVEVGEATGSPRR